MTSDRPAWLWDAERARIVWANAAGVAWFGGETLFDLIDYLADWLTDETSQDYRTGYCEQFAASMAVLGRALNVPTRVVWGFTPGEEITHRYAKFPVHINAINLRGVFLCMKYEIPLMLKQGGGAIVNTSSGAGVIGIKGSPAYTAAKHGVIGLTRSAADGP